MSRYESSYQDLDPETRLLNREKHVAPLVDGFFAYFKSVSPQLAPKAELGRAIAYCLNQESFLRVSLTDGYVPMTNNAAKRSIRSFTQGRKN
jgi:transposase